MSQKLDGGGRERVSQVLARWLDVWGALEAESLGKASVQAPRNFQRGVPQHHRRKGLGHVDLEENLRGRRL